MLTQWPTAWPPHPSPTSGPEGLRARVGFEAEQAARRRRNADRSAAVGGVRQRKDARRHGRRRSPEDPPLLWGEAPGFRQGPNIAGSVDGEAHLRRRRFAEGIEAGGAIARHDGAVVTGNEAANSLPGAGRPRAGQLGPGDP